jgi:hypothetical protein
MKMFRILLLYIAIINSSIVISQNSEDTLDVFVANNKQIVKNQIALIKKIFYSFQDNQSQYRKKILVCKLHKRDSYFLIDLDKMKELYPNPEKEWIQIYIYKKDSFCRDLDYSEIYYFDANNRLIKITCDQGDYPDGFNMSFTDYYYDNNKLIFAFSQSTFTPPMGFDMQSKVSEERYYFLNNRPIRCLAKSDEGTRTDIDKIENKETKLSAGLYVLKEGNGLIKKLKTIKIIN